MDLTFQVPRQYCSLQHRTLSIGPYFYHLSHPQLGIVFALAPFLHSFWSYFSTDLQSHIGHLLTWGVPLSVSYHFAFSYCSWGSQGKNTEVVCRPFRYDLNQILYDYTVEVRNRFKGLDLIECLMSYGMRFVTLYRRQGSRPSP